MAIIDFYLKGGPIMGLLLACSVLGVYIVAQKLIFLKLNSIGNIYLIDKIKHHIISGQKAELEQELSHNKKIMLKLLCESVKCRHLPQNEFEKAMYQTNKPYIQMLFKNMGLLSSIITVAPILGLLGTIIGLMDIFNVISGGGIGDPELLSSGIATALITTVTGLSITIPFIFLHQLCTKKIETFIDKVDALQTDIYITQDERGV